MTIVLDAPVDCEHRPVDAALLLARAFNAGRRLVVSSPIYPDHAHHVAVEFMHPVIAGASALPAIVELVPVSGRTATVPSAVTDVTLLIGDPPVATHEVLPDLFIDRKLPDAQIMICYHLLWELVQVCLEHPGLVGAAAPTAGDSTGFLYPFLDAAESDEAGLRSALDESVRQKRAESADVATAAVAANREQLEAAAAEIRRCADNGGRVLTMGNGGSASDAARLARLFHEIGIDTVSLAADYAVLSALANDLGADHVFARQVEALARPGDVLIGCSTSGSSPNLLKAFERARRQGVTGIGFCGYGGGRFVQEAGVAFCLAVESTSVHRIQEAEALLVTDLVERTERMGG